MLERNGRSRGRISSVLEKDVQLERIFNEMNEQLSVCIENGF